MTAPNVNAANLVLGPANLWVGAFGAAEPADSSVTPNGPTTPPSSPPWTFIGGTEGGVTWESDLSYTDLDVDQVIMPVGSRLTSMKMNVMAKMSEVTLANLTTALNSITTSSSGSGWISEDITVTSAAVQPTYAALIIDGVAPTLSSGAQALRRIIVRKVLAQTKVSMVFDKKTQASYDVTFNAYYVSSSINPVHIVDQVA